MRPSAEIGSENEHQVDAGAAGELHQVVHRAEFRAAGDGGRGPLVAAVVEHADDADVGVLLRSDRLDQRIAALVCANHDGAPVEPAFAGPAAHEQEQRAAEADQHDQTDDVERAEPYAGEFRTGLGEEGRADHQQEHDRPGRGEAEILLLVAAKGLHLVNVGGLERQQRQGGDAQDRGDVMPFEPVDRNHVGEIDRKSHHHRDGEFEHPDDARDHDRRPGCRDRLRGDLEGGGRERSGFLAADDWVYDRA